MIKKGDIIKIERKGKVIMQHSIDFMMEDVDIFKLLLKRLKKNTKSEEIRRCIRNTYSKEEPKYTREDLGF